MSKPSRRPARETRKVRLQEQKKLREEQRTAGLEPRRQPSIPNTKSPFATVEEETQARQEIVTSQAQVIRAQLPTLLKRLSKIPDPRNPQKIRHQMTYGRNERQRIVLHVVVCEESWEVVAADGERQPRKSRHAWVSSHPLSDSIVHERCNLGARHRWGIEANILVEKHQGYRYEHSFAYEWNAMKGYHYLMRLGHFLNVLARYSKSLQRYVRTFGVRGLTHLVRETLAGPWLDPEQVRVCLDQRVQLRLT